MKDFICEYFNGKGDSPFAEDYTAFCDWIHDHRDFSREITSGVLTNLDLKKSMAKKIVSDMMNGSDEYREQEIIDNRLRSLVTYYFSVMLFSQDARMAESAAGAYRKYRSPELDFSITDNGWLSGKCIVDHTGKAVVTMRPGDFLYSGYRFFVINMQCFASSRFMIGMRTDGGIVRGPMKCYKGCSPAGIGKAYDGSEWNLMECDNSLSDDNLAIIYNTLDGEGTVEVCDWINDDNQRVVFRQNY